MLDPPDGAGRTLRDISIAFLVLTWVVVILRMSVRISRKCVGADDWSMVGGLALFSVVCATTIMSAYNGIGAYDNQTSPETKQEGRKWFFLFQVFYCANTVPIKSSICIMLIRLTPFAVYRYILYGVIIFSTISAFASIVGIVALCTPVARTWNLNLPGHCGPPEVLTRLGYFISASCIVSDWSCAVMPIFILWNSQMRWLMKISVGVVLALGVLASTGNLVRFQYVIAYENTTNYYYGIANIAIWSIVESGTGIIAGSTPALAPLIKHIPIIGRGFIITPEGGQQATQRRWRLRHITNPFPTSFKTEDQSRPQRT
ncbi:unnamed protein product [Clonostachys rhizophaga]|uniref:Rhodopsin domain-containing protein n=1 Tax=Clonostachys rhizophaga TaxID=160324 RepID=A0A9N9VTU9_9HYPO|nr:unnamed protein product [Clonostachys rhizophaga]